MIQNFGWVIKGKRIFWLLWMISIMASCRKSGTEFPLEEVKMDCITGISPKKVLFVGIDGCRTDALLGAQIPIVDSLMAHAYVNLHCDRGPYTVSCPGWSTLLYGVFPAKHGVTSNNIDGQTFGGYHDLFYHLRKANAQYSLAVVSHWDNFLRLTTNENYALNVTTDFDVKNQALYLLQNCVPDVLLLHFDEVDEAGHNSGFSPSNPEYVQAIRQTGTYLEELMQAVEERERRYGEQWMVVVVTDHGGQGTSHGNQDDVEVTRYVFEICRMPGLQKVELATVSNVDILPSIFKYLGVPIDSTAGFDGVSMF